MHFKDYDVIRSSHTIYSTLLDNMEKTEVACFATGHTDIIHDNNPDFYGNRVVTASSDGTVKVFSIAKGEQSHLATLTHHKGPVFRATFTAPSVGNYILSAGQDGSILLWKEDSANHWTLVHTKQTSSPIVDLTISQEHFVTADVDGKLAYYAVHNAQIVHRYTIQLDVPAMAVALIRAAPGLMLASGDCTGRLRVHLLGAEEQVVHHSKLHASPIRSVAWGSGLAAPSMGLAVGAEDGKVTVMGLKGEPKETSSWMDVAELEAAAPLHRVCFDPTGRILAVSAGTGQTQMFAPFDEVKVL